MTIRGLRSFALVGLSGLALGCGVNAGRSPAAPTVPAPAPVAEETQRDYAALARRFIDELAQGHFDRAASRFDATMAAASPPPELAATWQRLESKAGRFKSVTGARHDDVSDKGVAYHRVTAICQFGGGPLGLLIVFGPERRIAGFFIVPAQKSTQVAWRAPDYAIRSAFEEQAVAVGQPPWQLPATLTLPRSESLRGGQRSLPAVVLVHGSGPNDRDESIGGYKAFKDLAWGLASRGVAVLRYVKRTRKYPRAVDLRARGTVKEEVLDDAWQAVALLQATPGVDAKRVVVIGHSLGGGLAPRLALGHPEVAGVIVLAGPTRRMSEIIVEQIDYLTSHEGTTLSPKALELRKKVRELSRTLDDPKLAPDQAVDFLGAITPGSYWIDLRAHDPAATAAKLKVPILVLQGGRDYQVRVADFDGWKRALGNKRHARLKLYPALNHHFVAGEGPSTPAEYARPGHVAREVIEDIAEWIAALRP